MSEDDLTHLSEEEIKEILQSLVRKGFVKETVVDGEIGYSVTQEGEAVVLHSDSDPKTRN